MVIWSRIRYSRIETLTNQCKRHYYVSSSIHFPANHIITTTTTDFTNTRVSQYQNISFFNRNELYGSIRFFAAPVFANQQKAEKKVEEGRRMNDKIKAEFVRLVIDDG
ncbi:hypothetical protein FRX31_005288 [Thalictrum thalictroides]|uniref:Uncharacterized protein n=1 Tax=Thalictrum thalictroides TaxID=46969 RepID=A0A7J6X5N7_THATH|nr:hypothetical protein FRX31_005288 [Thalictrum thalictroides]